MVNALIYLSCILPIHAIECTGMLQSISLAIFLLSGVSSAAYSLFRFYKKHGTYKAQLISTGIVALVAGLAALVIYVIAPTHNAIVFAVTMVSIWLSLSSTNQSLKASAGWLLIATFLAVVMIFVHNDFQALIPLLYAVFSTGATLRRTGARRLAMQGCHMTIILIGSLIGIMGYCAVDEMGMLPISHIHLIVWEGIERTIPHVDGVMAVVAVFIGLAPFYRTLKDPRGYKSSSADP